MSKIEFKFFDTEKRKPTLEEAIQMLRYPESNSLHIIPLTDDLNVRKEATIIEPLIHFGKKDLEIVKIIMGQNEKYHLKIFDNNNHLVWEEICSS